MLDRALLGEVSVTALRLAVSECPAGHLLTTSRLLSALSRVDVTNDWQRFWLHTGEPPQLAGYPDSPGRPAVRWDGMELSAELAQALNTLARICAAYGYDPAPSGAVALALLASPSSGAAQALLSTGALTHPQLLALVQSELLNDELTGLAQLIAPERARPQEAVPSGPSGHPPVLTRPVAQARPAPSAPVPDFPGAPALSPPVPRRLQPGGPPGGSGQPRHRQSAPAGRRWRLIFWRSVSVAAFLLAIVAIGWNRDVLPPPAQLVVPPYPVPPVAARMLSTSQLPVPHGERWLLIQNGPPTSGLFVGTGRLRAELRRETVAGAWQREWVSADGQDLLEIRVIDMRLRALARQQAPSLCQPAKKLALPGVLTAGFLDRQSRFANLCVAAVRGRATVLMQELITTKGAPRIAPRLARKVARRQLPRLPATATDLPGVSTVSSATRTAINSIFMTAVLGIPLLFGFVSLTRDRSTWRRVRARFARPYRAGAFSIDSLTDVRMAAYLAMVLVRISFLAWAVRLTEVARLGLYESVAVIAGAAIVIVAIEPLLRRLRPVAWRPRTFTGRRWIIGAVSLAITAAIGGAGLFLVLYGLVLVSLGTAPAGAGADSFAGRLGLTIAIAGLFVLLLALLPFTLARRLGMRYLRQQVQQPPFPGAVDVLMLRSFADDRRVLRTHRFDRASVVERLCLRRFERFEEVAASALAVHGPVIAASDPREKLPPPLGAVRRTFANDEWEGRVGELIGEAGLICVTVGRSESLVKEIKQIRLAGALNKTLFLLPPTGQAEQRRRLAVLGHALDVKIADLDCPRPCRDVLAVAFPAGRRPVVITGKAQNDIAYECTIAVWAFSIATGSVATGRPVPADLREMVSAFTGYAHAPARPAAQNQPSRPAPRIRIYPAGKAPAYRPWWRRWWLLPTMASTILSTVGTILFGISLSAVTTANAPAPVNLLVQDEASSAVYAVYGGHELEQIDFQNPGRFRAIHVGDQVTDLVVNGNTAYYTSAPTGYVGRIDLPTGHVRWRRFLGAGARSPALASGHLVVAEPAVGAITELAAQDGATEATRPFKGTPLSVVAASGQIYASLYRSHRVAVLALNGLAVISHTDVPAGPFDLVTAGSRVWVCSILAHVMQPLPAATTGVTRAPAPPGVRLLLSVQNPDVSSNGGWIALQGMEWVSVLSPAGNLHRIPLDDPGIHALTIERDGSVVVGYASGEITHIAA